MNGGLTESGGAVGAWVLLAVGGLLTLVLLGVFIVVLTKEGKKK